VELILGKVQVRHQEVDVVVASQNLARIILAREKILFVFGDDDI
jgi:hypothetical protein